MTSLPIRTWTQDGIPLAQAVAAISERTDEECAAAWRFFTAEGILGPKHAAALGFEVRRAGTARTSDVLRAIGYKAVRTFLSAHFAQESQRSLDAVHELYALLVEHLIRQNRVIQPQALTKNVETCSQAVPGVASPCPEKAAVPTEGGGWRWDNETGELSLFFECYRPGTNGEPPVLVSAIRLHLQMEEPPRPAMCDNIVDSMKLGRVPLPARCRGLTLIPLTWAEYCNHPAR